jgi:hypothetical protein
MAVLPFRNPLATSLEHGQHRHRCSSAGEPRHVRVGDRVSAAASCPVYTTRRWRAIATTHATRLPQPWHCSNAVTNRRVIAFMRQKSGGVGCGTGPLARYRLAPRRREIAFWSQSSSPLWHLPRAKALVDSSLAGSVPPSAYPQTRDRSPRRQQLPLPRIGRDRL